MRYSERLIEQEINKDRRYWPDGSNIRKELYTDHFNKIINHLKENYKIEVYIDKAYDEYRYLIDNTIELVIDLDNRGALKNNFEDNCFVVLLRRIEVIEEKRGKGIASKFISDLLATSEKLYPKMSYLLFPYHDYYTDDQLIRLGKWYISLGFFPLFGELCYGETKRPYIKHNLTDVYKRGIRGLGWGLKMLEFRAKPEEFTELQKKIARNPPNG